MRRIALVTTLVLAILSLGALAAFSAFKDRNAEAEQLFLRCSAVAVGMTEAEVIRIMGPGSLMYSDDPATKVLGYANNVFASGPIEIRLAESGSDFQVTGTLCRGLM